MIAFYVFIYRLNFKYVCCLSKASFYDEQLVKTIFFLTVFTRKVIRVLFFSVTSSHQPFFFYKLHIQFQIFLTVLMIQHVRKLGPEITIPITHADNLILWTLLGEPVHFTCLIKARPSPKFH